jgi:branched-chain amino acid aminotransferase
MALHSRILHNGQIRTADSPALFAGQIGLLSGWGVFSTLRVTEGALFAWERHWARMSRDARLLNVAMPPDADAVERDLLRLIEANGRPDCTLRLAVVRNSGGIWEGPTADRRAVDVIALTADSKQWGESVQLGIEADARFSRNEFAGAKILSWAQNLAWAERAARQGFDEVVLLNERGLVAECTSANVFAVFGNEAITPPLSDGCLPGITREILLKEIHLSDAFVVERSLTPDDLYRADEVFISSTTRDLLPVREIAGRELNGESGIRQRLSAAFRQFLQRDIASRKLAALSL